MPVSEQQRMSPPLPHTRRPESIRATEACATLLAARRGWSLTKSQYFAWPCRRHRFAVEHDLAVHNHRRESFRILMRLLKGRHIAHPRRIENCDVGLHALAQQPSILQV